MKRLTRAKSIKLFCLSCFGWEEGREKGYTGHDQAVKMVRECESIDCALYNFRTGAETTPGRTKLIPTARQKAVRNRLKTLPKTKGDKKVATEQPRGKNNPKPKEKP